MQDDIEQQDSSLEIYKDIIVTETFSDASLYATYIAENLGDVVLVRPFIKEGYAVICNYHHHDDPDDIEGCDRCMDDDIPNAQYTMRENKINEFLSNSEEFDRAVGRTINEYYVKTLHENLEKERVKKELYESEDEGDYDIPEIIVSMSEASDYEELEGVTIVISPFE